MEAEKRFSSGPDIPQEEELKGVAGGSGHQKTETEDKVLDLVERSRLHRAQETLRRASETALKVGRISGQRAERKFVDSARYRQQLDEENRSHRNPIQTFLRRGVVGFAARTVFEAIPTPIGYGPGDLITGISALRGRDILTGDRMDILDRILYGVATAVPVLPGTVLVVPAKFIRRKVEDAYLAYKSGNHKEAIGNAQEAHRGVREITELIRSRNKS